jgi:epoxide hydrolase-like predicted phosphatase
MAIVGYMKQSLAGRDYITTTRAAKPMHRAESGVTPWGSPMEAVRGLASRFDCGTIRAENPMQQNNHDIKALILDFGGVLVTMPHDSPSARRLAGQVGVEPAQLMDALLGNGEWNRALVGEISAEEYDRRMHQRFGLPYDPSQPSLILRWFADETLSDELLDLASSLRRSPDFRVAVLSNASSDLEEAILDRKLGILHRFDLVVNSAREGVKKPDTAIYHRTLERLNVAPHEAIFVDDMPENVAAAAALGIHAIHFQDQRQAVAAIRARLDRISPPGPVS